MKNKFLIVGHRGAAGSEKENTLQSLQKAIDCKVDMIEIDVQTCKSGELVLLHDKTLDRTTGLSGSVKKYTLKQLNGLIPSLSDAICMINRKVPLNIEIKETAEPEEVYKVVVYFLKKGWTYDDFLISSFHHEKLQAIRKLDENIHIGVLFHNNYDEAIAKKLGAYSIHINEKHLKKELMNRTHALGMKLFVYTPELKKKKHLQQLGVDGMFTDTP